MTIQRISLFMLMFTVVNIYTMDIDSAIRSSFLDMQEKYDTLSQIPEFQAYEDAKKAHKELNTPDTQYIVDLCEKELHRTKEYQDWLRAEQQQKRLIVNPTKSHNSLPASKKSYAQQQIDDYKKQVTAQADLLKRKAKIAWHNVLQTVEYKSYKEAMTIHEALNNYESLSELKKHKRAAQATQEYWEYCKAEDAKRMLLAELHGYGSKTNYNESYQYPDCTVNYVEQHKTLKKLNWSFLPIRTIDNSTPSTIPMTPVMKIIGEDNRSITVYRLT